MATRFTYLQARLLLLLLGVGVAIAQAAFAWDRGAADTEVLAPVLYIPVFIGAIFWLLPGGLIAAGLSSIVYGVLLADQSSLVGVGSFRLLLGVRVFFYFFFAVITAVGVRYIESRLRKLEVYDQIDDETGLYNSAFFLQDSGLEVGRADRYRTLFSVVSLDVRKEAFEGHSKRRYQRTLRDLAGRIRDAVRQVDRPARIPEPTRDRFLIILPETGREGAQVFADRLRDSTARFLTERGCRVNGHLATHALTYPDEPEELTRMRDDVARVESRRRAISDES